MAKAEQEVWAKRKLSHDASNWFYIWCVGLFLFFEPLLDLKKHILQVFKELALQTM